MNKTVTAATTLGGIPVPALYSTKHFAVTPSLTEYCGNVVQSGKIFTITHILTGYSACRAVDGLVRAKKVADGLEAFPLPWGTKSSKSLIAKAKKLSAEKRGMLSDLARGIAPKVGRK